MPVYTYKALKQDGAPDQGVVDADSPKDARLKLKGRHLHVTDLEAVGEAKGVARVLKGGPLFRRRRPQDVAMITRQLATLLGSGIPMIGALSAIIEQVEFQDLKAALMDIREKVSQGGSLSDAMAQHPIYFNELYANMVKAGEAGGNLDKVLVRIADYLHAQNKTRAKVMAALTYPIIMVIIGVGVVLILLTFVVPKILDVIQHQNKTAALPLPTELLVMFSSFMSGYWYVPLAAVVFLLMGYARAKATPGGRLWLDSAKLKIPVFGTLVRKTAVSRFAVTFATLLESGLPVLEAMGVVRKVVDNELMARTLDAVRQKVAEGADIAGPVKQSKVFPPVVGYMIGVGEESGRLEELLKKIAQSYDEEVEVASQKLTSLLEPLMIVLMSGVVGFIVLAILLPILEMSNI